LVTKDFELVAFRRQGDDKKVADANSADHTIRTDVSL
jgi:hypothetical protein